MKRNQPTSIRYNGVGLTAWQHQKELLRKFSRILSRGTFLNGQENTTLEAALQRRLGGGYVTTVASGHDALLLSLLVLKLTPSDEVIFPVNAYPTAFPVALSGTKPVPVDTDENGQIDHRGLKRAITSKTKAVIVVHLYGLVGAIGEIREICRANNLILIEDCAQAFSSLYQGKPVGTLGDVGCFSFYPTKNLGALGDGGAIWTRNRGWHAFFQATKAYGEKTRYASDFVAGHSRLPELQAGALNVYLVYFDKDIRRKQAVRIWYEEEFHKAELTELIRLLNSDPQSGPAQHLLVVEVRSRDRLQRFLKARGIDTLIHYPIPVHLVPAFSFLEYKKGDFPVAERLAKNILSLPFHPYLTRKEVKTVVQSIRDFYHGEENR